MLLELKYELYAERFITKCKYCFKDAGPGMVIRLWENGYIAGSAHCLCAIHHGWDGKAAEPPLRWDVGSTQKHKTYVDGLDTYELIPIGDGSGGFALLKHEVEQLAEFPDPAAPKTVPAELQARLWILAEKEAPLFRSRNEKNLKKALAARAAEIYNMGSNRGSIGRVADEASDRGETAKEPVMAATASVPAKGKSFIKSAPNKGPAPAKGAAAKSGGGKTNPDAGAKAKAPRTSASEEEIAAAIAGTLKARAEGGSKKQESLTALSENGRHKGRPIGVTTGLPILLAWCLAFQENSKTAGQSKIPGLGRKSDEAITKFMKSEFPGRDTPAFDHPAICRNDYNKGRFTQNQIPKIVSERYGEDGSVVSNRGTGASKSEPKAAAKAAPAAKATPGKKTLKA